MPHSYNFVTCECGCDGSIRCCMRCPSGTDPICVKKKKIVWFDSEMNSRIEREMLFYKKEIRRK